MCPVHLVYIILTCIVLVTTLAGYLDSRYHFLHRASEASAVSYWAEREELIKKDESRMLGASIVLNKKEKAVNDLLMGYKLSEYDHGFKDPGTFAPGKHFFEALVDIEKSKVFEFIKKVPKGASLHGHDRALMSEHYVYNLTFRENLYGCTIDEQLRLRFLASASQDNSCNWTLLSILRQRDPNFNKWLHAQISMNTESTAKGFKNINQVWKSFSKLFKAVHKLVMYKPIFKEYYYQLLKEQYEDNIMYVELRTSLDPVYELDGSTYTVLEVLGFFKEVFDAFKKDHPDFLGARLIYGPSRAASNETFNNYTEVLNLVRSHYPDLIAGFDLVGQEDLGHPLTDFIGQLLPMAGKVNFFFHAGETNWYGSSTDFNLYDAILLGTKRIGHGYALSKHPVLMEIVKQREIGIEICPISNQVLMLVNDIRNHPAATLIADGSPVVISADDPGFWSAKGLSYDFYMAFMGIASRNADLRLLKQLSQNSIKYSAIPDTEKPSALKAWEEQWDAFIQKTFAELYGKDSAVKTKEQYI